MWFLLSIIWSLIGNLTFLLLERISSIVVTRPGGNIDNNVALVGAVAKLTFQ